MILRRDSCRVLYNGTVRRDLTLHVYPVRNFSSVSCAAADLSQLFNACQWEDQNSIFLLGFEDAAILESFVELFELGRIVQE